MTQNQEFIYRGDILETPLNFQQRIVRRFPNAEILSMKDVPTKEMQEGSGQCLCPFPFSALAQTHRQGTQAH